MAAEAVQTIGGVPAHSKFQRRPGQDVAGDAGDEGGDNGSELKIAIDLAAMSDEQQLNLVLREVKAVNHPVLAHS